MARDYRERDWLLILVALTHGLRVSEVLEITPDHFKSGVLITRRLKGSNKTEQPLVSSSDPLFDEKKALFEFSRGMLGNQRLFKITPRRADQIIKQHCKAADIPEHLAHMHTCKHTTAMEMIGKATVPEIQRRLGHKNGGNTLKYLEVSDQAAAEAYERSQRSNQD